MNGTIVVSELAVSSTASLGIATSVDASPLLTALITLGVSLVTIVGGEIVKYLYAFFKKKREDLEGKPEEKHEDKKE